MVTELSITPRHNVGGNYTVILYEEKPNDSQPSRSNNINQQQQQVSSDYYPEQRAEEFDNAIRLFRRFASLAAAFDFLAAGASTARLLRRRGLPAAGRT